MPLCRNATTLQQALVSKHPNTHSAKTKVEMSQRLQSFHSPCQKTLQCAFHVCICLKAYDMIRIDPTILSFVSAWCETTDIMLCCSRCRPEGSDFIRLNTGHAPDACLHLCFVVVRAGPTVAPGMCSNIFGPCRQNAWRPSHTPKPYADDVLWCFMLRHVVWDVRLYILNHQWLTWSISLNLGLNGNGILPMTKPLKKKLTTIPIANCTTSSCQGWQGNASKLSCRID